MRWDGADVSRKLADSVPSGHCLTCSGGGRIGKSECQSCSGSGHAHQVISGDPCILCEGSGRYTRYSVSPDGRARTVIRVERCMACNGSGRVNASTGGPLPTGWTALNFPTPR